MTIQIGSIAPDFSLFNSEKNEVSLSSYKGKTVVLLFIPQAFTGVCTTEFCSIRDNIAAYTSVNAEVLGISVDSVFTLAKWKELENYNFQLLSDFNKEVSRSYGCLYEDWILGMKGVSKRSAFVIDGEGTVRYAEVLESAGDMPNLEAIKNLVASL
jgi:peroxiredoxin